MTDILDDELEFIADMETLNSMVESLMFALLGVDSFDELNAMYFEVDVYGDEPAFTSIIFDKLVKETNDVQR